MNASHGSRMRALFAVVAVFAVAALVLAACQPNPASGAAQSTAAPAQPTAAAPAATTAPAAAGPAGVKVSSSDKLGKFLVGLNGMTLYIFASDKPGVSNCADKCAQNWPPLLIAAGQTPSAGDGAGGKLATIQRADGGTQVTYDGMPLYYWVKDKAPGDTTGQGVGGVWAVARPVAPPVQLGGNDKLGKFLVGANGMTLYTFAKDSAGTSNCADQCAKNWPPLLLKDGDALTAGAGVNGELASIKRADGGTQVTYKGMPVYFYIKDQAPGDAIGQGVGGVWAVAAP